MSKSVASGKTPIHVAPLMYRRRDAAIALGVSESQIDIWGRTGVLPVIRVPGIRAVRYATADVEAFAARWKAEAK